MKGKKAECSMAQIRSHNLSRLPGVGREPVFFSRTPACAGETAGRAARPTVLICRDTPLWVPRAGPCACPYGSGALGLRARIFFLPAPNMAARRKYVTELMKYRTK